MTKPPAARGANQPPTPEPLRAGSPNTPNLIPMHRRRVLFALMAIVLTALAAFLLWTYFSTVYPNRHKPHSVEFDTSAAVEIKVLQQTARLI